MLEIIGSETLQCILVWKTSERLKNKMDRESNHILFCRPLRTCLFKKKMKLEISQVVFDFFFFLNKLGI